VNAERSIRSIKEKGTLRISLGTGGESVWATFSDDGPSPPAETLAIASDSPQADDPTVRTQDGGLNLCESLMAEQGGTIQALAMPEGGAAFTITLPAASGSESV
jgi:signal transduction histidine kinase